MIIIGQVSSKSKLEKQFGIVAENNRSFLPQYLINKGKSALLIASNNLYKFQSMEYGLIPFWSKNKYLHYEAPIEGDSMGTDEITSANKRIILHPTYRKPIRENRCVIPSDYVIVHSNIGQYYLIRRKDNKPLILAGVYDLWKEQISDKELYNGFAILTTPSGSELNKKGIIRLPLLITDGKYQQWIKKETPLIDIISFMKTPDVKNLIIHAVDNLKIEIGTNSEEITHATGKPILDLHKSDTGIELGKFIGFRRDNDLRK